MPGKQIAGHCGGNVENRTPWGQGIAPTKAGAIAAAKADFATEVTNETTWLDNWASNVVCPHKCRYKLVLPIRKSNYNITAPRWNATKKAFVVDITEDFTVTVQCFPLKVEEHQQ